LHPHNLAAQINAVNKLLSHEFQRWHPIVLNQEYLGMPRRDVFEGIPEDQLQAAYWRIYAVET
jgi:hypothetical protein